MEGPGSSKTPARQWKPRIATECSTAKRRSRQGPPAAGATHDPACAKSVHHFRPCAASAAQDIGNKGKNLLARRLLRRVGKPFIPHSGENTMRKTLIAAAVASAFASSAALAELSFNVGLASEYSYRGISQSDNGPALSGGIDFAHDSGFYVGTWASTIKWLEDTGLYTDSKVEVDLYGGFKFAVAPDLGLDVGVLRYQYPGDEVAGITSPNTTEVYVAGTYKMVTLKYSRSTTNLFGWAGSKGSGYLEANASFELFDGYNLDLHVGQQKVKDQIPSQDYTDYKVGVSKDFGFLTASLAYVGTSGDQRDGAKGVVLANGTELEDWYKGRAILSVSKSF
jgi:uncharacterized protein (TIGR02001 family)